nr:hypothetical protein [Tanacetum cinerariifolium]
MRSTQATHATEIVDKPHGHNTTLTRHLLRLSLKLDSMEPYYTTLRSGVQQPIDLHVVIFHFSTTNSFYGPRSDNTSLPALVRRLNIVLSLMLSLRLLSSKVSSSNSFQMLHFEERTQYVISFAFLETPGWVPDFADAYGDEDSDDTISNDEGDKNQNSNIFGDDDDAKD